MSLPNGIVVEGGYIATVERKTFLKLVENHRPFFEKHGVKLNQLRTDHSWYLPPHTVLLEQNHHLPPDLKEAFLQIIAMACSKGQEALLDLARENHYQPPEKLERMSAATLATHMWNERRDLFFAAQSSLKIVSTRGYKEHYDRTLQDLVARLNAKSLARLEDAIRRFWKERRHLGWVQVATVYTPSGVSFLIGHAHRYRADGAVESESKTSTVGYFPQRFDTVAFSRGLACLAIHAQHQGDVEAYRKIFGEVLFNNPDQYVEYSNYDGSPLLQKGLAALSTEGFPELQEVVLKMIQLGHATDKSARLVLAGRNLRRHVDALSQMAEDHGVRQVVRFRLAFKIEGLSRQRTLEITPPNRINLLHGEEELESVIQRFFRARGFLVLPQDTPAH